MPNPTLAHRVRGRAAASGVAAMLIALAMARPCPAQAAPTSGNWRVLGSWQSIANGDDVRDLAGDGDGLWAATFGGGAVHWLAGDTWRQYLAPQDGLLDNDVRAVVRWRGRFWFGTAEGLAYYDPSSDRMVQVALAPGPESITALCVDEADRLWVAMTPRWDPSAAPPEPDQTGSWDGGGVAVTTDGSRFEAYGIEAGLPSLAVRDLVVWRGALWAATEPYWHWRALSREGGQEVPAHWELIGGGVAAWSNGRWDAYDRQRVDQLSDNVQHLAPTADALWIGTAGRGLVVFDGSKWLAMTDCGNASQCIQDDYVTSLAAGADGAIWVGTARFNGRGTGAQVLVARGTPTDAGDDAWFPLRPGNGLPGERVGAMLASSDGSVWLGLADWDARGAPHGAGLARLLADRHLVETRRMATTGAGAPLDNDVTAIAWHALRSELWVGTSYRGISVRDREGHWRHYTRATTGGGLGSDDVADIAIEPSGVVWVATRQQTYDNASGRWVDGGLSRFDGSSWRRIAAADSGLPSDQLSSLALGPAGKLWVGTGATTRGQKEQAYRGWGLAVVDTVTGGWERTYAYPTLSSNNITDLAVSGSSIWAATAYYLYVDTIPGGAQLRLGGGASAYDATDGSWQRFGPAQGLTVAVGTGGGAAGPLLDFRSVAIDSRGATWLGGLGYAGGVPTADQVPDGVVDVIHGPVVEHHRFAASGAVVSLSIDAGRHVWAATERDGLYVSVSDGWLHQSRADGVPFDELTALDVASGEAWLGGANAGLARLTPLGNAGVDPGEPSGPPPPLIAQMFVSIYCPLASRQADLAAGAGAGPAPEGRASAAEPCCATRPSLY